MDDSGDRPYASALFDPKLKPFFEQQMKKEILAMLPNESQDGYDNTRLHLAVKYDFSDLVQQFIQENKDDLNASNKLGKTSLFLAAEEGSIDSAKLLIDAGADITIPDKENKNLWHIIAEHSSGKAHSLELAKLLLNSSQAQKFISQINQRSTVNLKETPLESIHSERSLPFIKDRKSGVGNNRAQEVSQLLFKNGALGDPKKIIQMAVKNDDHNMVRDILKKTTQAITSEYKDDYAFSISQSVAQYETTLLIHHVRSMEMIDILKKYMPKVSNKDYISWSLKEYKSRGMISPLHIAAQELSLEMVDFFLKNGVLPNTTFKDKGTPLDGLLVTASYCFPKDNPQSRKKEAEKFIKIGKALHAAGGKSINPQNKETYEYFKGQFQ